MPYYIQPRPYDRDPYRGAWYNNINPNEHSYTPGYGFSPWPPAMVEKKLIRQASGGLAICMIVYMLLASLLSELAYLFIRFLSFSPFYFLNSELVSQLLTAGVQIFALLIPFSIYCLVIKIPRHIAVPLRSINLSSTFTAIFISRGFAVIGVLCVAAISALLALLGLESPGSPITFPSDPLAKVLFCLNMTVIPAMFEEMAFRGVVMQSLRRFGDGFALLCSSILFAIAHGDIVSIPNAFVMGLVLGYFVLYSGSLWTGVIVHLLHNAIVLLEACLIPTGNDALYAAISVALLLFQLMIGLGTSLLFVRQTPKAFAIPKSNTINGENSKLRIFFSSVPMVIFILIMLISAVLMLELL